MANNASSLSRYTPVVVGVGDVINRSLEVQDAKEPLELILDSINSAIQDTRATQALQGQIQSAIDSIDVVRPWTWPYADLPALLATSLRITPKHKFITPNGGNQTCK